MKKKDKDEEIKDAEITLEEEKESNEGAGKVIVNQKEDKALFLQRLVAFCLDIIIVAVVSSLFASHFIDTDKSNSLTRESNEIVQKFVDNKIDVATYADEAKDISYKIARNNGVLSIVTMVIGILYYVVFQIYNGGQTLGKKLMKIKVVADSGDLTMNQMIFRALIANSILVDFISFAFLTFGSKDVYFYCSATFGSIQYIIILVSALMVMYRFDGCAIHDKLAHTRVVRV